MVRLVWIDVRDDGEAAGTIISVDCTVLVPAVCVRRAGASRRVCDPVILVSLGPGEEERLVVGATSRAAAISRARAHQDAGRLVASSVGVAFVRTFGVVAGSLHVSAESRQAQRSIAPRLVVKKESRFARPRRPWVVAWVKDCVVV